MTLSRRFNEAFEYAAEVHGTDTRKGTDIPYLAHLLGVTSIALEHGADEDEAIAALLHDAIEDGGGPPIREEIHQRFGNRVVEIVNGCTDTDADPKPPWRERKEQYIAHIPNAPGSVRLVSAADKLHNVRAILRDYRAVGDKLWGRFNGGKDGTLWYYRELLNAFKVAGSSPLIEELERTLSELEAAVRN